MPTPTEHQIYAQENLLARLDRIPVNRTILLLVGLLGLTWILEAFDIGIIAPVLFLLRTTWHLRPAEIGLIASAGTLGIVIGLLPAGLVADRFGRKTTLVGGIVIFSVFTFVGSFSQNVAELVTCRFIAGLGQGAVFPVPYLLLSEFVNKRWRGTAVGLSNSLLGFSYGLNTLAGALIIGVIPNAEAWRVLLILGGATILITPLIMIYLPESPRFLLKVGRIDKVRSFVERLENISGLPHDETLIDQSSLRVLEVTARRRVSLADFVRPPYLTRCIISYSALLSPFVVFYVITIYGPSILHRMGASKSDALYYTSGLLFLTVISTAMAGSLGDRISRRWGLVIIMTVAAIGTIALGQPMPEIGVVIAAIVTWSFVYAGFPLAKLYMAEQFPTRLRASGAMIGESITRFLGGVVLVYLFPIMASTLGSASLFTILAILTAICIIPIWLLGFQTSGLSVEQTGTDLSRYETSEPAVRDAAVE
ncbi:MFS transporter [Acidiphilium sp. AL]|uniref:MFS transporter n=1 Tax=Acidiphilium sp. AL TaxID=2871704 RepID=UPI0021CB09BF|nr:MFS transporter [Acidiphilium sp. AL]MCU4161830.1 MFS transporter [Acidiphilium sp. AL]